jgi:hypothetical protein
MSSEPRNPPKAVVRGKELADLIRGRDLLYKARNYMGPVHVDEATCSYRWFRLKMTTQPWSKGEQPRALEWIAPPGAVSKTATKITVRAYDAVGMLIHDAAQMKRIEALRAEGADVNELLRAFNYGRWDVNQVSQASSGKRASK